MSITISQVHLNNDTVQAKQFKTKQNYNDNFKGSLKRLLKTKTKTENFHRFIETMIQYRKNCSKQKNYNFKGPLKRLLKTKTKN